MKGLFFLVVSFALVGCVSIPAPVIVSKSDFDGSTQIIAEPGWVGGAGYVKFGLSWNSKMPANTLRLDALVANSGEIAAGESLHFNIDGQIFNFSSSDIISATTIQPPTVTQFGTFSGAVWAMKSYTVSPEFISKILHSTKTAWRLDLFKDYREGVLDLNSYGPTIAMETFKNSMTEFERIASK